MNLLNEILLVLVAVFCLAIEVVAAPPLSPEAAALEAQAGYDFTVRHAPNGIIAVMGGARLKPGSKYYEAARQFGYDWTHLYGTMLPIATGRGPGAMYAANLGAMQANGPSLGYNVDYPGQAPNHHVTASISFTDNSLRESALIDYARAYVAFPGGTGTAWEIAEALAKIEHQTVFPRKVILVGTEEEWRETFAWLKPILGDRFEKEIQLVAPEDAVSAARLSVQRDLYYNFMRPRPVSAGALRGALERTQYLAPNGYLAVLGNQTVGARRRLSERGTVLRPGEGRATLALDGSFLERADAIYAYPGDIRTYAQLLSAIDRIAHGQMKAIPIYLLGREEEWAPFKALLASMEAKGYTRPTMAKLVRYETTPAATPSAAGCPHEYHNLVN